jgi:hypothetical protein
MFIRELYLLPDEFRELSRYKIQRIVGQLKSEESPKTGKEAKAIYIRIIKTEGINQ